MQLNVTRNITIILLVFMLMATALPASASYAGSAAAYYGGIGGVLGGFGSLSSWGWSLPLDGWGWSIPPIFTSV